MTFILKVGNKRLNYLDNAFDFQQSKKFHQINEHKSGVFNQNESFIFRTLSRKI